MVREYDEASKGRKLPESAEKSANAYGVPKIPATPKPPSLGAANTLGAKPAVGYRDVPPLGKTPQLHKPVADLGAMSASRSSDAAARGSSEKLNDPGGPAGA